MAEHDSGYKLLFSQPTMVEELFKGFIREPWVEGLDFTTLERVSESFTSDGLEQRHGDMAWRLRWVHGEGWLYVYFLLEFQSTPDAFMAVRLLTYVSLLYDNLVRARAVTADEGLPAVLSVVLYNGRGPWGAATDLASLFRAVPPGFARYLPQLTYILIDEKRLRPEEVLLPDNRVAALFRLEASDSEEVRGLIPELEKLLPRDKEPELRRAFTTWLVRLLRRRRPGITIPEVGDLEDFAMLEETLDEWWRGGLEKGRSEGRAEGRQEGKLDGMRQLLLQLLEQRFGILSHGMRRQVEAISSAKELSGLAERVLVARSLEEMGLG